MKVKHQKQNNMYYQVKVMLLSATLVLLCVYTQAQNIEEAANQEPVWMLQGSVSALRTSRILKGDNITTYDAPYFNKREMIERPSNGFQIEMALKRKIGKHLFLGTGFNFTKFEYLAMNTPAGGGETIDPQFGFVYVPGQSAMLRYNVGYYYTGIPLSAMVQVGKGNVTFVAEANITPTYLLGYEYKSQMQYENVTSSDRKDKGDVDLPEFNLLAGLSAGLNYQMFSDISFSLQAQYMHGMLDVNPSSIQETLQGVGLKFGIGYWLDQQPEQIIPLED